MSTYWMELLYEGSYYYYYFLIMLKEKEDYEKIEILILRNLEQ